VNYRHVRGQTVGPGFDGVGDRVPPLVEQGLGMLRER
jgi:hypothetical protein